MIRIIKIGGKLIENDAVLNGLMNYPPATGIVYWYMEGEVWPDNCLRVWGSGPV